MLHSTVVRLVPASLKRSCCRRTSEAASEAGVEVHDTHKINHEGGTAENGNVEHTHPETEHMIVNVGQTETELKGEPV